MKKDIKLLIESLFNVNSDADVLDHDEYDMTGLILDYVDLGLPSGTKWCKYNVGAKTEIDYGDYYQWGETKDNIIEFKFDNEYAKYNEEDKLTLLLPEDDIAYQTSKGLYRIPTAKQIEELVDNTDNEWVENYKDSGVNGYVFSSEVNDNYIFIPAAGYYDDNSIYERGKRGCIWGSSIITSHAKSAHTMLFSRSSIIYDLDYSDARYYRQSVRGVLNKK